MRKKWNEMLSFILDYPNSLNDWETGFIDSVSIQLSKEKDLSFKQSKVLRKIYHTHVMFFHF